MYWKHSLEIFSQILRKFSEISSKSFNYFCDLRLSMIQDINENIFKTFHKQSFFTDPIFSLPFRQSYLNPYLDT